MARNFTLRFCYQLPLIHVNKIACSRNVSPLLHFDLCNNYYLSLLYFSVHSSPPNNIIITSVSATTIEVMWDYDQNGVVIGFEILYVPLETFGGVLVPNTVITSASDRSAILNGLQEYVEYSISIRSYTSLGAGSLVLT